MGTTHYEKNKEKYKARARAWRKSHPDAKLLSDIKLKKEVLTYYGNGKLECVLCGFKDIRALSLDHIDGGGTRNRKALGGPREVYRYLRKVGYPPGYRTLCMNCQFIERTKKSQHGGGKNGKSASEEYCTR